MKNITEDHIKTIEVVLDAHGNSDVTFYFDRSEGPWNAGEFEKDSVTRRELEAIERSIDRFNRLDA